LCTLGWYTSCVLHNNVKDNALGLGINPENRWIWSDFLNLCTAGTQNRIRRET
jgi:hypothetical protein